MMKRWWLIALVFTLALSLTSCSRRRPEQQLQSADYGFTTCAGTIGDFDIYVIRSAADPGIYELVIIPVSLDAPSDIAQINIANQAPSYKTLISQITLYPGEEVFAGNLTESDLEVFNILSIATIDPQGGTFLEQSPEKDALCELPLPGDGTDGTGVTYSAVGSTKGPRTGFQPSSRK